MFGDWLLMSAEPEIVGLEDIPSFTEGALIVDDLRGAAKKSDSRVRGGTARPEGRSGGDDGTRGQDIQACSRSSDAPSLAEGTPPLVGPDGSQDFDMGDSASTCFHDAESSVGDESSESGDVSSTQDEEEDASLRQDELESEHLGEFEADYCLPCAPGLRSEEKMIFEDVQEEDDSSPENEPDSEHEDTFEADVTLFTPAVQPEDNCKFEILADEDTSLPQEPSDLEAEASFVSLSLMDGMPGSEIAIVEEPRGTP